MPKSKLIICFMIFWIAAGCQHTGRQQMADQSLKGQSSIIEQASETDPLYKEPTVVKGDPGQEFAQEDPAGEPGDKTPEIEAQAGIESVQIDPADDAAALEAEALPSAQQRIDQALELCNFAQQMWEKGKLEEALSNLDSAYYSILEIDPEKNPEFNQQKEDIRYLISKRILEIYASRQIVVNGQHNEIPITMNRHVKKEIKRLTGPERKFFIQSMERSHRYRPFIVGELKMAGEVQVGLLPREGGRRGRLDVAFRYFPMLCVGGDLFDVVETADGGTAFFISDVSGHGVGAAFVTAMIKTSVLAYSGSSLAVADLVSRVNAAIANLVSGDRFVTAFFGILNAEGTKIEYVNAGHLYPLLIRAGTKAMDHLESTEFPLGIVDEFEFTAEQVDVSVGDRLVLYTDGIIEAPNDANEQFGMARFEKSVVSHGQGDLETLVDGVIKDLMEFAGRDTFDDDVNLVACEVVEP